jgi:nitrogen fixation protein FixH
MTDTPAPAMRWTLRGRHVLFTLIGFFAVCVAVDGFMIYRALTTFGGVDNVNAYRDGLAYNDRIAQEERQSAAGWRDSVEVLADPQRLRLAILDRDGRSVPGIGVRATIARPATNRFDVPLPLRETAPGVFEANVAAFDPGSWIVSAEAFSPGEETKALYETRRRVWLKP